MDASSMTFNSKLPSSGLTALLAAFLLSNPAPADETNIEIGGHNKSRIVAQTFPSESIFHDLTGSASFDVEADLRVNLETSNRPWSFNTSYQLIAMHGERVEYARQADGLFFNRFPEDERRLFDLTGVIDDDNRFAALHRLDRLWLGYATDRTVIRLGRQAVSWGNGLVFSPMDIVNPFDPTAIDTEYKTGDDMAYAQFLRRNGDDIQAAAVFRRNPATGDVEGDQGTLAIKYHGIGSAAEFDVLVAVNHDDTMIGIGGNRSIGGAIVRADLVVSDTRSVTATQLVTNVSYSWTWGSRNVSGALEYYYNGFGQNDDSYDLQSVAANPELLERLARGELYSIGRHYLAGSLLIEMTPLWLLTPIVFLNLEDQSALVQLISENNLQENLAFLGSINIPIGPRGSEYGGFESSIANRYVSSDLGVFAQLAWYF